MTSPHTFEPGSLDLRLFGAVRLFRNGVELPLPSRKPAAALKILALRGGAIHRDKLVAALWPDEDLLIARPRLRNVLSKLRRTTGVGVQERSDSVRVLDTIRCDVVEFIQIGSRVLAGVDEPRERSRLCLEAQALWVGPPLEEDCFEAWARPHRRRAFELQRRMWDLLPSGDPNPRNGL